MRNSFLARGLCAAVSASLVAGAALPSTVRASDWTYSFEDDQQFVMESATEDAGFDFVWEDPVEGETSQETETGPPQEVTEPVVDIPIDPVPVVEDPTPAPSVEFWDDQPTVVTDPVDPVVTPGETPSEIIPTPGEVVEEPFEFVAEISVTPTPIVSVTPSPTPTPSPIPTVTPLVAKPVTVTTSMVSNLHAGKEFYLNSLKSSYALSFAEGFDKVMDEIEYEYLAENHLIRPDGTRGVTDEAYLQYLQEQQWVQAQKQAEAAAMADTTGGLVVLDFDGFTSDGAAVSYDTSWDDYAGTDPLLAATAQEVIQEEPLSTDDLFGGFTSGPEEKFTDLVGPEGLLARNWQDVLAIFVYQQVKLGATEFNLNRSAKQALSEIFREMNPITFVGNTATYANYHVGDYIRAHNIPKWDRVVLKKYTETDCKLLCATVTAAKGFVRQSVGDYVSEERVNVIAAAYSLVGKVGYFWGGKSTYLGVDPRWGQAQVVTAEGSGTSGTLRAYGLDCSGFVTWAVINGYQNTGMKDYVGDGTSDQWNRARVVSEINAQPGDLVFQSGPEAGANNHVGILVGKTDSGDWIAVHCSSGQNGVTVGEAYSASFRYIREPSFYPLKTAAVVIGPENIDDILVPADVSDGYDLGFSDGFTDGTISEYVNEDFMDIVLFDTAQQVQEPDILGLGDGTYDVAPATEGLVVLDETGRGDTLGYLVTPTAAPVFTNPAAELVVTDEDGTNDVSGLDFFFTDETAPAAAEESVSILIEDPVPAQQLQEETPAQVLPEDYGNMVVLDDWGELSESEDIQAAAVEPDEFIPQDEPQEDLIPEVPVEMDVPEVPVTEDSLGFTDASGLVVLEDINGMPIVPQAAAETQVIEPVQTAPQVIEVPQVVFDQPSVVAAPQPQPQPDLSVMSQLVVLEDLSSDLVAQPAPADPYFVDEKMLEVVTLDFTGEESIPEQQTQPTRTASENLVENVYHRLTSDKMVQDAYNAVAKTGINQESGLVGNILRSPAVTVTPIPVKPVEQPVVPCDAANVVVICFD